MGFSLKFFFLYFVFYALIATVITTVLFLLPLNTFVARFPSMLQKAYPQELQIQIKNGEVSTNVKEPYIIPLERVEKAFNDQVLGTQSDKIHNLLVIDTQASIEDFNRYQTAALLTKTHLTYLKNDHTLESVPLKDIKDLTINQQVVNQVVDKMRPLVSFVLPLLIIGTFIALLIVLPAIKLLHLIIGALILMLVSKLMSYPLSYSKSYQIGLHLIIVVTTISAVVSLLHLQVPIPFWETLLLALFGAAVFSKLKTTPK